MKWDNFRDGIQILDKYIYDDELAVHSRHDQIFVGPPGRLAKISEEDKERLKDLGWYINEKYECLYMYT